ncbi:MAG: FtsH protease activity modulator HflK [Caulobacterales bacterium]
MPWNDESGESDKDGAGRPNAPKDGSGKNAPKPGPWGERKPQNPWERPRGPNGPNRPGNQGPDLEDYLRQLREKFGRFGGGPGRPNNTGSGGGRPVGGGAAVILALAVIGWFATGIYFVDEGEEAMVLRLGAYDRTTGPGAQLALPFPLEQVRKERVTEIRRTDVGVEGENLMLTADENIVDLHFAVNWRITDLKKYVLNLKSPEQAVRMVGESVMRQTIGRRKLEGIITIDRAPIELEAREQLQKVLNSYNAGILIAEVNLVKADPPKTVIEAFRSINNAQQEAATNIQQATQYANKIVPEARGDAAKLLQDAEGYASKVEKEAAGDASRFNAVYEQYRQQPQVTRRRIYLETMERVLSRTDTIIVDKNSGALPFLPLDQMRRPRNATPVPQGDGQ